MKSVNPPDSTGHFALKWLPWIIAAAAMMFYLATVNPWLSLLGDWTTSMGLPATTARIAGWTAQPETFAPAYYLLTYPLRWLPEKMLPYGLNLFSLLCATLTLWQLARSVALLPHDRTRGQRDREENEFALLTIPLSWLPPLFAVAVCGFQMTFLEHATNGTVEMLDLLLFAYVLRNILEFRVDENESRLCRAAFVFAVGMANNLSMIAYFPLFVIALIWSQKLAFFKLRFLGRITLCGLAGLLLLLVLPLIASNAPDQPFTFWQLLKTNLNLQKFLVFNFPKVTLLLLMLYSLVPVFLFSIRWAASFGDPSQIGVALTTLIFHLVHLIVLLACLWVSLDPAFSPRIVSFTHDHPFVRLFTYLTLYYLVALNIGYFSGYFLLAFRALGTRLRPPTGTALLLQNAAVGLVIILSLLIPAALLYRNLPQIRLTNGPILKQLATAAAENLPDKGILLADDGNLLFLAKAQIADSGRKADYVAINSFSLKSPAYQTFLARNYPGRWQAITNVNEEKKVDDGLLIQRMLAESKSNHVTYLHPSFGYYYEAFNAVPHGLSFHLTPHPGDYLISPAPDSKTIALNEDFWAKAKSSLLPPILSQTIPPDPNRKLNVADKFFGLIKLRPEKNQNALIAGAYYSRALVCWGVQLQRAGEFQKALPHFDLALKLNPDNAVAEVNGNFTRDYLAGKTTKALSQANVTEKFGKLRTWEEVLNHNGPYDEPSLSYVQGIVFYKGGNLRQAAECFSRVRALAPDDVPSCLLLAKLHIDTGRPDIGLDYIKEVRERADRIPGTSTNMADLFTLEASAWFAKNDPVTAVTIIEKEVSKHPTNPQILAWAKNSLVEHGRFTNALQIIDRELQIYPDNVDLLFSKGTVLIQAEKFEAAIATLDHVLNVETNASAALLNRAIAKLRMDRFDDAKKDYETLQRQMPAAYQIDFGLAEIALRQNDTNAAIRNYESYLTHAQTNSFEWQFVSNRVWEYRNAKTGNLKTK